MPSLLPMLPPRRLGAVRLALAGAVLVLAPAAAQAYTMRPAQSAVGWYGQRAPQPVRTAKRAPAKGQAKGQVKGQAKEHTKTLPPAKPAEAAAPAKSSERAGTWTAGEGGRACFRSRRKLWQADEGWIVKKVNVCP